MELLVSVRSPVEVNAALDGGADIIDAKEPTHGPLGAVSASVLARIVARVPAFRQLSIAMGDFARPDSVWAAITALPLPSRPTGVYLKFGFAGLDSPEEIRTLIDSAVGCARGHVARPRVIAVAYADAGHAGSAAPEEIVDAAAAGGAAGVLIDTYRKDGRTLFGWVGFSRLARCFMLAHSAGLTTAAAGSLGPDALPQLAAAGADIAGFRGAACSGGRQGRVSPAKVQALRSALDTAASDFIQGSFTHRRLTAWRNA